MQVIDPSAHLGEGVKLGNFVTIGAGVVLGDRVQVGNCVTIYPGTQLGEGVFVGDNAVVGKPPRPAKTSSVHVDPHLPPLVVGPRSTIGTGAVVYAGSRIGADCLIADQAFVREGCTIGDAVIVGQGVCVENQVLIGDYTKIQSGAYITAYSTLEDHVFVAPMVTTTNDNFMGRTQARFAQEKGPTMERGARVGGAAITLPGVRIAQESFIATGALVTKDTAPKMLYMGLPAKPVRPVPEAELLENQE
ncbi:MAG: N-acetyltransferase [Firmicutes bacterium]|nr:N-acetyltransferase [Bacillota bacterium]